MNKSKSWISVAIPCTVFSIEAVGNFLFEMGAVGIEEQEQVLLAYFSRDMSLQEIQYSLNAYLDEIKLMGFNCGEPQIRHIKEQDWGRQWRKYFQPIEVTSHLVVKPPWLEYQSLPDQIVIDIMPRMAFGTGTHETTRLSLRFLEKHIQKNDTVLDLGVGSGILSITAAKLGAKHVLALDIDEEAVRNARENVKLNFVEKKIEVRLGSIKAIRGEMFNLIVANINRPVLMKVLPNLIPIMNKPCRCILSGILLKEKNEIETCFVNNDFKIIESQQLGEWLSYVVQPVR